MPVNRGANHSCLGPINACIVFCADKALLDLRLEEIEKWFKGHIYQMGIGLRPPNDNCPLAGF
jgi:hypothetical protein